MVSDLPLIITWWFVFFAIGVAFLPVTGVLFGRFFDRGYIFSKIFGLLVIVFFAWFFSFFRLVPFSSTNFWIAVLGFAVLNYTFAFKKSLLSPLKSSGFLRFFVLEEVLFFFSVLLFSFVRGFAPDIHGLEKYMDFGFINSILRTDFLPPKDIWLSGSTINYYYFGHFLTALLTKLSFLDPAVTFNLMLAAIFGFSFVGSFSIVVNLVFLSGLLVVKDGDRLLKFFPIFIVGVIGGFLVTLGGNLHTIYVFTSGYPNDNPVPFWQILSGFNPSSYWYPNATRFIPYTIHEFPSYSFVVSDLHGHVLDIPFVIFSIALVFSYIFVRKGYFLPIIGTLLGAMYMTNAWDGIIYLMVAGLAILLVTFSENSSLGRNFLKRVFVRYLFVGVSYFLVLVPFNLSFKPFVSGINLVPAGGRSPVYMLLVLWGFFLFNALAFVFLIILPGVKRLLIEKRQELIRVDNGTAGARREIIISLFGFRVRIEATQNEKFSHGLRGVTITVSDSMIVIFIIVSAFLLVFPEFFYIKDIYPQHYRANTVFKLGYQAFIMMSIASSYIFFRISGSRFLGKYVYLVLFAPLFLLVAIYPYFGFNSYYGSFKTYYGLNGVAYLQRRYPSDFAGISFLAQSVKGQPVVLEAVGESYTDYARVSVHTGLPVVVGWPVHEWLWRGSYDEAGKRVEEVRKVYEDTSLNEILPTLNKYQVEYIFVGQLERQKYQMLSEQKFYDFGKVIFENGETRIFKKK